MERAAEAIQSRAPAGESEGLSKSAPDREYHVTFDGRRWNIWSHDGVAGQAALDRDMAVTLAIRAACHDHADGLDASVSVEEQDGTFTLAWSSV